MPKKWAPHKPHVQNFSYHCVTNSATAIPEYFASGGKKKFVNQEYALFHKMALQHRNLLLNSFLILLDLGKFGSGWSSRGIKVSQGGRRKMGVGRGDSSDQVERQRQRSTKA